MDKRKEELTSWFLKFLYERPNAYYDIRALFKKFHDLEDNLLAEAVIDDLLERKLIKAGSTKYYVVITYAGRQVIEKYGNYPSFLRRERIRQRSGRWRAILSNAKTIIAIITGTGMLIFAGLAFFNDKANARLKHENTELRRIIDSLKTKKPSLQVSQKDSVTN